MGTRPTAALPDWNPAAPDRVEPDGSRKGTGYAPLEPLPAQSFNWLFYSVSVWLTYLIAFWRTKTAVATTLAITPAHDGAILHVTTAAGAFDLDLPDPSTMSGVSFKVRDVGGVLTTYPVTLDRFASETINGLAADFLLEGDYGEWTIFCDGTNYFV